MSFQGKREQHIHHPASSIEAYRDSSVDFSDGKRSETNAVGLLSALGDEIDIVGKGEDVWVANEVGGEVGCDSLVELIEEKVEGSGQNVRDDQGWQVRVWAELWENLADRLQRETVSNQHHHHNNSHHHHHHHHCRQPARMSLACSHSLLEERVELGNRDSSVRSIDVCDDSDQILGNQSRHWLNSLAGNLRVSSDERHWSWNTAVSLLKAARKTTSTHSH